MRVFLDNGFTNLQDRELISLGLAAENGSEFYGESTDFDLSRCSEFIRKAVLPQLGSPAGRAMPLDQLRLEVTDWLHSVPIRDHPILCYDYDGDRELPERPDGWPASEQMANRECVNPAGRSATRSILRGARTPSCVVGCPCKSGRFSFSRASLESAIQLALAGRPPHDINCSPPTRTGSKTRKK